MTSIFWTFHINIAIIDNALLRCTKDPSYELTDEKHACNVSNINENVIRKWVELLQTLI